MSVVEVNAAIKKFLEEVLLKKGKVIGIAKTDVGWKVKVEIIEEKKALPWESYPKISDRDLYEIILSDDFEVVSHSLIKGETKEAEKEIIPPKGKVKRAEEEAEIQAQKERERLAQDTRREKEEARREEEKARRDEERARKEKEKAQREAERLAKKAQKEKEKELKRLALEKEREEARLREKARKDAEEERKLREAPEVKVSPKKKLPSEGIRNEAIKHFEKGILLYYASKNEEAINEFQKVIKDYPTVTDVVVKARQYIGFCRAKVDKSD